MSAARSLLRLELKRSVGLLLFPLLLLAAWYGANTELPSGIYLWLDTSYAVRYSVPILGALVGGAQPPARGGGDAQYRPALFGHA